jgi:hypothetical protein
MSYTINSDNGTPKRKIAPRNIFKNKYDAITFVPASYYPSCKICGNRFADVNSLSIHLFCGCSSEPTERKFGRLNLPAQKNKHPPQAAPTVLALLEAEDSRWEAVDRFVPLPDPIDEMDALDQERAGTSDHPPGGEPE